MKLNLILCACYFLDLSFYSYAYQPIYLSHERSLTIREQQFSEVEVFRATYQLYGECNLMKEAELTVELINCQQSELSRTKSNRERQLFASL